MTQSLLLEIFDNARPTAAQTKALIQLEKAQQNIQYNQSIIYEYLLYSVKIKEPDEILQEFKKIFIYSGGIRYSKALIAISELLLGNDELEFRNTLKRSCYILLNNWYATRQYQGINALIKIFIEYKIGEKTGSPTLDRLQKWIVNFINSKDYQELNLFVAKYNVRSHWKNRFTSYLLVPQYVDLNNPVEQRSAAKIFSQQLKDQFKFELAMYTARSQSAVANNHRIKNPTGLGDEVLPLVKAIVLRRGAFSYTNLAHIFVKQNQNITYKYFKKNLIKYLIFDVENENFAKVVSKNLAGKLERIYENYDEESLENSLRFRTCNRVIEYLITNNKKEPSELFILLLTQGHVLNLVVVLVKLVLICKNVRAHLEACLAVAIQYYEKYPEDECQWLINFLEILNVTLAIYTEDVEYNLVQMPNANAAEKNSCLALDGYRIFSQFKEDKKAENYEDWS
ncbi:hypothetical protein [Microseira wollei]|uniref:Uncharacterized protein n=1 Tax=Microseira wollei NIES-4236 TaxID=2530354 RepID=A0AAV3X683_9CYAN|nr:hypothetical protein [Microseira wollei]GET38387.1 hypothetical protein MC7420_6526 [Microseira wollei NIES-4236]